MAIQRNLKAFVRYDGSGRVVAGSLILRKNKPKVGRWQEIPAYECCNYIPTTTTTTTASPTTTTTSTSTSTSTSTTTTTTAAPTTTTTTTAEPTTTTTTTAEPTTTTTTTAEVPSTTTTTTTAACISTEWEYTVTGGDVENATGNTGAVIIINVPEPLEVTAYDAFGGDYQSNCPSGYSGGGVAFNAGSIGTHTLCSVNEPYAWYYSNNTAVFLTMTNTSTPC